MKRLLRVFTAIAATCLPSLDTLAASPSALVNPGFEDAVISPDSGLWWTDNLPGWRNYMAGSGVGSYWNVNQANASGWAEASIRTDLFWDQFFPDPDPFWWNNRLPLPEGHVSISLSSRFEADRLITDTLWAQPGRQYTGDSLYLGRAGISQSIGIPAEVTELTCYYADLSDPSFSGGSLVLSFNNQVLGYTLEPTLGPNGPTTRLRADLTPVAGQYGELRLGIEGPGFFVVDNIIVVPEASTLAGGFSLVLAAVLATTGRSRRVA